jgi:hypothetical protein
MPSRRTLLDRSRLAVISPEIVRLFAELEAVPIRQRKTEEFKARSRELARLLGLGYEWFCMQTSVLDREAGPCHPPGYARNDAWAKVRIVRARLLAAARDPSVIAPRH